MGRRDGTEITLEEQIAAVSYSRMRATIIASELELRGDLLSAAVMRRRIAAYDAAIETLRRLTGRRWTKVRRKLTSPRS